MALDKKVLEMIEEGLIESFSDYCDLHFKSACQEKFIAFNVDQKVGRTIFKDTVGLTFSYLKSVEGVIETSLEGFFLAKIERACYQSIENPHEYIVVNYWQIGLSLMRKMHKGEFFWEQDILQDCAMKVASTLEKDHSKLRELKSYFLTAVRNAYFSSIKAYKAIDEENIKNLEGAEHNYSLLNNNPEKDKEAKDIWDKVNDHAREKCKEFIHYYFDIGVKKKDIADILNVSGGGVTYIWSQCLEEIRKMLGIVTIENSSK